MQQTGTLSPVNLIRVATLEPQDDTSVSILIISLVVTLALGKEVEWTPQGVEMGVAVEKEIWREEQRTYKEGAKQWREDGEGRLKQADVSMA